MSLSNLFRARFGRIVRSSQDDRGVSAVEFALILPALFLFYGGAIELSSTLLADRKVTNVASSLGDLTARLPFVTSCDVDDIFEASRMIFQPHDSTSARLRLSSIVPDPGDPTKSIVSWSRANSKWTARAKDSEVTLPTGILTADGSVILAEVEFTYTPPLNNIFQSTPVLKDTFYLRPRKTDEVAWSDAACT